VARYRWLTTFSLRSTKRLLVAKSSRHRLHLPSEGPEDLVRLVVTHGHCSGQLSKRLRPCWRRGASSFTLHASMVAFYADQSLAAKAMLTGHCNGAECRTCEFKQKEMRERSRKRKGRSAFNKGAGRVALSGHPLQCPLPSCRKAKKWKTARKVKEKE
jgi:hypothetical protein